MKERSRLTKLQLSYDEGLFNPSQLLTFVEMEGFTDDWTDAGLTDDDLQALQIAIMVDPAGAPVVPGTGGLRKLRFSPSQFHRGKSGALRVCYVYYQEFGVVLLVIMYDKTKKDNLTAQQRKAIKQLTTDVNEYLSKRYYRIGQPRGKGTKL